MAARQCRQTRGNRTKENVEMDMTENFIELVPEALTQGVSLPGAYLLIMREKEGKRHLPLLLDAKGYEIMRQAIAEKEFPTTRLMSKLAMTFDISLQHVLIRYARTGKFFASLFLMQEEGGIRERILNVEIANGLAAAIEKGCPIFIFSEEFERLYSRQDGEGKVAIPLSSMGKDLLAEALRQAVETENFELASQLRDEMKKRDEAGI